MCLTVLCSFSGSLTWIPAEVAIGLNPSLEYDLQGLEQASEYEVRVLSRNEYGASPGKELLTVETDEGMYSGWLSLGSSQPRLNRSPAIRFQRDPGRNCV